MVGRAIARPRPVPTTEDRSAAAPADETAAVLLAVVAWTSRVFDRVKMPTAGVCHSGRYESGDRIEIERTGF
jgi:hypothetical protein